MKKQTAVDLLQIALASSKYYVMLINDIANKNTIADIDIFKQAKFIEKEQIINAHIEGQPFHSTLSHKAEEYFNKTYL